MPEVHECSVFEPEKVNPKFGFVYWLLTMLGIVQIYFIVYHAAYITVRYEHIRLFMILIFSYQFIECNKIKNEERSKI